MEKDNKEREKLIELIKIMECYPEDTCPREVENCYKCEYIEDKGLCNVFARKADYLLRNNVFVPPCKVGDKVYFVFEGDVFSDEIILIEVTKSAIYLSTCSERYMLINGYLYSEMLDEKAYFTKEEAEQALVNYKSSKNDELRKEG